MSTQERKMETLLVVLYNCYYFPEMSIWLRFKNTLIISCSGVTGVVTPLKSSRVNYNVS